MSTTNYLIAFILLTVITTALSFWNFNVRKDEPNAIKALSYAIIIGLINFGAIAGVYIYKQNIANKLIEVRMASNNEKIAVLDKEIRLLETAKDDTTGANPYSNYSIRDVGFNLINKTDDRMKLLQDNSSMKLGRYEVVDGKLVVLNINFVGR